MPNLTAQTSLPDDATELVAFLDAYVVKYGDAKRNLFQALNDGENIPEREKELQLRYRLSCQDVRNALTDAEAMFKSAKELEQLQLSELEEAIKGISESIKKLENKLKRLQKIEKAKKTRISFGR